jgi:hypothetical protein
MSSVLDELREEVDADVEHAQELTSQYDELRERAEKAKWMLDEAIVDGFTRAERMYPAGCDQERRRIKAELEDRYARREQEASDE